MSAAKIQIVYRDIDSLRGYPNNPRKNSKAVQPVMNSIAEFGFKVPMVIEPDGTVVTGHTRLAAAKELGIEQVPCIVADDLTPEQIKAFRLADNKVSEFAEWDPKMLDIELAEIPQLNMEDFGFMIGKIDWSDIPDLSSKTYKPPIHNMIRCPHCGHVDRADRFMKVGEESQEGNADEVDTQ